jgi:Antitoxin VbhA
MTEAGSVASRATVVGFISVILSFAAGWQDQQTHDRQLDRVEQGKDHTMRIRTTITAAEQARRLEAVRQIRHSTQMEGGRSSDEARADQDAYARGEISSDELIARTKAQDR